MDSKNDYKVGGLYLVKKSHFVFQIEILAVTEKAYRIRWEGGNSSWVDKDDFHFEYYILERM